MTSSVSSSDKAKTNHGHEWQAASPFWLPDTHQRWYSSTNIQLHIILVPENISVDGLWFVFHLRHHIHILKIYCLLTRASLVNPHLLRLERHVTKLLIPKYCSRPLLSLTISLKVPACLMKYQTDHPICLLHLTTIRYGMAVYGILQKTDVDFGIVIQLFP